MPSRASILALAAMFAAATTTPHAALAADYSVPRDEALVDKTTGAARTAVEKGDHAGALRELDRLLELNPNEPVLRGVAYAAMAGAAEKSGDIAKAIRYRALASRLDPGLEARLAEPGTGGTTRGRLRLDDLAKVLGIVVTTAQSIEAYKRERQERKLQEMQAQQQMQAMQQQMQQLQAMQAQMKTMQGQAGQAAFPTAALGEAGYAAPPQGYTQAPGFAPAAAPAAAPPAVPAALPASAPPPAAQAPEAATPAGGPGFAPPPEPYATAANWQPTAATTRGASVRPLRVWHDHSELGDRAWFGKSCGALLTVADGKLVFTPGGGEAPRVIPADEVLEIRTNRVVGRDRGAFHVATDGGLWLNLMPEGATSAAGEEAVRSLTAALGLK